MLRLSFFTLAFLLGACSSPSADDEPVLGEDAVVDSAVRPGSFKLYGEPGVAPNPNCDVHTSLVLGPRAVLSEVVGGDCEIHVDPNERTYALHLDRTECGSRVYIGTSGEREITLTDHRARICRDIPPAQIVVEETGSPARFSSDR